MISFFIDTCTSFVTIALLKDNKLINQKNIVSNRDLSNNLFEYIEQLFKEVAILPKDVIPVSIIYLVSPPKKKTYNNNPKNR